MNVLQLISSSGYFGAENVLVQLAAALEDAELCHVVSGVIKNLNTPHIEVVDESNKRNIETAIFPCAGKFDLRTIWNLRQFIFRNKIDIVHSHGYKSNLYSFFSTLGMPVKLIATCHNWVGDDPKMRLYAFLDRFLLGQFSSVVAVSHAVQQKILQGKVLPEKICTIRNGIDLSSFRMQPPSTDLKKNLGIPETHFVVGTVGRLSEEKGHHHLLNIFESIEKIYPEISFLIVGDGKLRKELQRRFNKPSIIFTGVRNDLPELYRCMDVFVLPSLTEGLPMVLLEAMASSLPVVATRVGDIPKVVLDTETGFLAEAGNERELEKYLMILLGDSQKRKVMGRKGYQRVKEDFSSSHMARNYMSIYRYCLETE